MPSSENGVSASLPRRALQTLAVPALLALIAAALMGAALKFAPDAGAQEDLSRTVLVHADTVDSPIETSLEAQAIERRGLIVKAVTDQEWSAIPAEQFGQYRAIVVGDFDCPNGVTQTTQTWGPQLDGNVIIVGGDPAQHAPQPDAQGAAVLIDQGIGFAVDDASRTGAYIATECTPDSSIPTTLPMLAGLSDGGFVSVDTGGAEDAHITATHPATAGLTDEVLSNWGDSTHLGFTAWPDDYTVLAIAEDYTGTIERNRNRGSVEGDGLWTAPDGTRGLPYILARGQGVRVVRNIVVQSAVGTAATLVGQTANLTAILERQGQRLANRPVTFAVISGPHAGTTGTTQSDGEGVARFSYTGRSAGTDTVVARFTDENGFEQSSEPITVVWQVPAPPQQPPPPPVQVPSQQLPPPILGRTVNAVPKKGKVRVKLPGSNRFVDLEALGGVLPVGTIVDATKGTVELTSADGKGGTQTALFFSGRFKIGQNTGRNPVTTLTLRGALPTIATDSRATAAAKKKARKVRRKPRRLWGDGEGRFRSDGRFSAATVRGTRWLVEDHCDYTLTRVRRGSVTVRDEVRRKNVVVRQGKTYRAWAPKKIRKRCKAAARRAKAQQRRASRGKSKRGSQRRK